MITKQALELELEIAKRKQVGQVATGSQGAHVAMLAFLERQAPRPGLGSVADPDDLLAARPQGHMDAPSHLVAPQLKPNPNFIKINLNDFNLNDFELTPGPLAPGQSLELDLQMGANRSNKVTVTHQHEPGHGNYLVLQFATTSAFKPNQQAQFLQTLKQLGMKPVPGATKLPEIEEAGERLFANDLQQSLTDFSQQQLPQPQATPKLSPVRML